MQVKSGSRGEREHGRARDLPCQSVSCLTGGQRRFVACILHLASCILFIPLSAQSAATAPTFVPQSGFYASPVRVELEARGAEAIYYTIDGSEPDARDERYRGPFVLHRSAVVRAVAYHPGRRSRLTGATYLIREPKSALPVVSVAISPALLYDPVTGIFVEGPRADRTTFKRPGANYWTHEEFTAHVDILESDGQPVFSSLTGLRLFGGISRTFPQKS